MLLRTSRGAQARPSPCLPSAPAPPVTRPLTVTSTGCLCCWDALSSDVHGAHALIFRSCLESPPGTMRSGYQSPLHTMTTPSHHSFLLGFFLAFTTLCTLLILLMYRPVRHLQTEYKHSRRARAFVCFSTHPPTPPSAWQTINTQNNIC